MARTELVPLRRLADGTVRQVNPFTATEVWTVPGRAHRPLVPARAPAKVLAPADQGRHCAFCPQRYLDTTPEKARVVRRDDGSWHTLTGLLAEELQDTVAQFRLIPNLFEIVSLDYWRINHGYRPPPARVEHQRAYLATPEGRRHVERLLAQKAAASGGPVDRGAGAVDGLFGGFHDVLVARRHFIDGAHTDDELAGSGSLDREEHRHYVAVAVEAARSLYAADPRVANVAVFQNWGAPAGASFDHLHKQLVALDTRGRRREQELALLAQDPDAFRRWGPDLASCHDLLIAGNAHAFAFAGVGHRFPSIEVWSRNETALPWELSAEELASWSDLLREMHRATGALVPSNEEWHHRDPAVPGRVPLRAVLKWRINTPAGFEGGTGLYVNTLDPWAVRDRVRAGLPERLVARS